MAGVDVKMLLLGVVLLAIGLILAWVEFALPEYFFGWFMLGLAGPLAWGLFAILIVVGAGLIYGGLKAEPVTESSERIETHSVPPPPPPSAAGNCPHCGFQIEEKDKFCGKCGKPVKT
jgi:hypothetical protein